MAALVRVWVVPVDVPPDTAARCAEVLDDGERTRAEAFLSPLDRRRFTVAHGALRIMVGRVLETRSAALTWIPGRHGKPELAPPWSGLHTSLSHSGDMIAMAISADRPVGVDIQHPVPDLDTNGLSARFFPPDEASYVAAGRHARARADRFAYLWVRKEAVVKAAGSRIWANLRIEVRGRDVVSCTESQSPFRIADVAVPRRFRAAVALTGAEPFVVEAVGWPSAAVSGPTLARSAIGRRDRTHRRSCG